ncbi:MAG: hypothetical protein DLM59_09515, partial [Pseudonocardiales bacterium]
MALVSSPTAAIVGTFRPPAAEGAGAVAPAEVRSGRSGIFRQLSDEWARLCGLSSAQHNLRRWATAEPVLDGATSLGDLLD